MSYIFDGIINEKTDFKYVDEYNCKGRWEKIKAITFEGEIYKGKRTKVFAYLGFPKKSTGKVPAVVLVHGGGCHAYCEWVKLWNDRGYAAIAMDTTGYFPTEYCAGGEDTKEENEKWTRNLSGVFYEEGYISGPDNSEMRDYELPIKEQWMY